MAKAHLLPLPAEGEEATPAPVRVGSIDMSERGTRDDIHATCRTTAQCPNNCTDRPCEVPGFAPRPSIGAQQSVARHGPAQFRCARPGPLRVEELSNAGEATATAAAGAAGGRAGHPVGHVPNAGAAGHRVRLRLHARRAPTGSSSQVSRRDDCGGRDSDTSRMSLLYAVRGLVSPMTGTTVELHPAWHVHRLASRPSLSLLLAGTRRAA